MAWLRLDNRRLGNKTGLLSVVVAAGKASKFVAYVTADATQSVSCTLKDMILGIGVDLCEVDRIGEAIARHGERFLTRIYTEAERTYCESKPNRMERFAGRFAAKEAAMKAIGTGWRRGVAWRDFEVTRAATGQPMIVFSGVARTIADQLGVKRALVSITHIKSMAMAQVVLESE